MNRSFFRPTVCALSLLLVGTGCGGKGLFARRSDTVARMDAVRPREHKPLDTRRHDMVVEVTTDAAGNVMEIHFQRSSGKDSVDAYVAESIRQGWPHQPSPKSVAAVSYSVEKGFTEPKILSNTPVP